MDHCVDPRYFRTVKMIDLRGSKYPPEIRTCHMFPVMCSTSEADIFCYIVNDLIMAL